jgi:hypothetical protein
LDAGENKQKVKIAAARKSEGPKVVLMSRYSGVCHLNEGQGCLTKRCGSCIIPNMDYKTKGAI